MIESLEAPFDAQLVDIHTAFQGHETTYTHVLSGGVHPTDAGYVAIADQMIVATVPEPDSLLLFVVGVLATVCLLICNTPGKWVWFKRWVAKGDQPRRGLTPCRQSVLTDALMASQGRPPGGGWVIRSNR